MRYYKKELWEMMNSTNVNKRERAEEEWDNNDRRYNEYMDKISVKINRSILETIKMFKRFHDYIVEGIYISTKSKEIKCCKIKLRNDETRLCIILEGLKKIRIQFNGFESCIQGRLQWGYSEFELLSGGVLRLSVLCDFDNEFAFEFKNLYVTME